MGGRVVPGPIIHTWSSGNRFLLRLVMLFRELSRGNYQEPSLRAEPTTRIGTERGMRHSKHYERMVGYWCSGGVNCCVYTGIWDLGGSRVGLLEHLM